MKGTFIVGLGMALVAAMPPLPAGADQGRLAIFDGYSGSHSVYMQGRATAVFALPADFFVGPTFATLDSQPRSQGYAATFGFPLARNATGVGVPAPEYRGQCWANYPGAPAEDRCGLPARELPQAPEAPNGSPVSGRMSSATVEASGDQAHPEVTRAEGSAAWGELRVGDVLHIGTNVSRSTSFIKDGVLHAVTASRAQEITVAGVLHIGMVEAMAEATHDGGPEGGKGTAHTDMQNVTIAGTPVAIGPGGLAVRGQPVGSAPAAVAGPVLAAMAEHRMTIEPLEPPRVAQDPASGLVEATTSGFRVVMFSPNGDKLEMIFGQAVARAAATRVQYDTPVGIDVPSSEATTASQPNEAPAPAAAPRVERPALVTKVSSRISGGYLAFCE